MIDLAKYAHKKICVAVSGGRDSMALLHYIFTHAGEHGIILSALNCDHKIRGEASARDSAFVKNWCSERGIPLTFFEWNTDKSKTESAAREWRYGCYNEVLSGGADFVATAHHLNDNAETVLFNLARGSALSGLTGITEKRRIIRPLIGCTRAQIDLYVKENNISYVDDETNFETNYTRNKIRRDVLPSLEAAVPNAAEAIYRFSRLAAEDELYFDNLIESLNLIKLTPFGNEIAFCGEKVIFRRAAVKIIKQVYNKKDYTLEQLENLFNLQFALNGKKFEFLNLIAYKEERKVVITTMLPDTAEEIPFERRNAESFSGQKFRLSVKPECGEGEKALKFDADKIPKTAAVRFKRDGDVFTKFGGGTKSLGDYFTDKKIPPRLRAHIPLIADNNQVLAAGGVEISDRIKIDETSKNVLYLICTDYNSIK